MTEQDPSRPKDAQVRQRALSRWETEGGAGPGGPESSVTHPPGQPHAPKMVEAELVSLHVRVIALENLVISLLATATEQQLGLAREMAAYISPRAGFTPHPMTTRAADHMIDLVERAERFCGDAPPETVKADC